MRPGRADGSLELFSHFVYFLHLVVRRVFRARTAFPALFLTKRVNAARNGRFTLSGTIAFT